MFPSLQVGWYQGLPTPESGMQTFFGLRGKQAGDTSRKQISNLAFLPSPSLTVREAIVVEPSELAYAFFRCACSVCFRSFSLRR